MAVSTREQWVKDTREKIEVMRVAANRVEAGEDFDDVIIIGADANKRFFATTEYQPDWKWGFANYAIRPKRTLRPFTAKEWGARIGDEFFYGAGNRVRLATVGEHYIDLDYVPHQFNRSGGRIRLRERDYETVKQLDGSPCGVFEEVKG